MKKNFFKKLSFVMALAMIISVIAPAASAFAATAPKLNATTKYLHLSGQPGSNEFDFNIANKQAGSKYAWSVVDENVATVDKNGVVTATGVGSTKVSVKITFKNKTTKTLTATVVVRDNIDTVKISNAPDKALAIDEEYDFNRSFTTLSGSTTKTSSVTRWTVDSDNATISTSGLFKATVAGTYKVTALAFQSTAKYDEYTASKNESLVLAKDEVTVTVTASVKSVKQVNSTKFAVTFDSDMSKSDLSKTTASVAQVINGKEVVTGAEKIKSLSLDSTGKVATVELYVAFSTDTTYTFNYGKLTGSFKAATRNVTDVAGVVFNDFNVNVNGSGKDMRGSVDLVNKDGVVIFTGDNATVSSYLTFTYGGDLTKGNTVGNNAYIYTTGYQAPVTVTFNNYVYDSAAQKYVPISFTDSAVATGVVGTAALASSLQFELVNDANKTAPADGNWHGTLSVAAKDQGYVINTRYYTDNSPYTYQYSNIFTYVSSDTSKLVINGNSAFPVAPGVVTVIVKSADGTQTIGTFDVTVVAARGVASVTADSYAVVVGNNPVTGETKTITVTATDNTGAGIDVGNKNLTGSWVNAPSNGTVHPTATYTQGTGDNAGKIYIDFSAKGVAVGSYQYKLNVQYNGNAWDSKDIILSVTVLDGTVNATVSYYKVDLNAATVDRKDNYGQNVGITVNGYNSNGVVVRTLAANEYSIEVKASDGTVKSTADTLIPVVVSGPAISAWDTGAYSVTAKVENNSIGRTTGDFIGTATFNVTNTATTAWTLDNSTVVSGSSILSVVQTAFNYTLNGNGITEANIVKVVYTNNNTLTTAQVSDGTLTSATVSTGHNVYISEVVYRAWNSAHTAYIDYSYYPGFSVTVVNP